MFLSCVPCGTFPHSAPIRRHRNDPVSFRTTPPSRRWPRSAFSNASGRSSRSPAIHGHRAKRNALPNLGHRRSRWFLPALVIAACMPSLLTGCAATRVAIAKRNLEVSTRMRDAVFLDPFGGGAETIANATVKDVTYVAITDAQISERPSSDSGNSRSTPSKESAAASSPRLPRRRRRSVTAPGSSAPRTRSISSTRKRRRCSTRGWRESCPACSEWLARVMQQVRQHQNSRLRNYRIP